MQRVPDTVLRQVQALTGLVFLVFVLLHLANTWLAALGPDAYDGAQRLLRLLYQAWPVEALLLGALATHILVAVLRKAGGRPAPATSIARWHRNAGIFLAVFIGGHIVAVRGPSWWLGFHPGFAGLSFTLEYLPAFFYPYYFALGLAGLFHGLQGMRIAARRLGWPSPLEPRGVRLLTATGAVLLALALLGLGGWLYDVGNPYDNPFARLILGITRGEAS